MIVIEKLHEVFTFFTSVGSSFFVLFIVFGEFKGHILAARVRLRQVVIIVFHISIMHRSLQTGLELRSRSRAFSFIR